MVKEGNIMRSPRQIAIETTNRCNLKCVDCPQHSLKAGKFPIGDMDWDLFRWIVDKIDFPTTIALWLNGEPLLHYRYWRMVEYIDNTDTPWTITTNAMLLDGNGIQKLCESKNLYQVIFSIDGFYETTFKTLRPGVDPEKIEKILDELLWQRTQYKEDFKIGVKLTEKGQDYEEIELFINNYLYKADYVIVGKNLGRINEKSLRTSPCRYSDDMLLEIRWDGTIIPCSYNFRASDELAIPLGKVQDYPDLIKAYNSTVFKTFRRANYNGIYPYPCDTCGFAYSGTGFEGKIKFRNQDLTQTELYYSEDYYNRIWSLNPPSGGASRMRSWKPDEELKG